MNHLASMSYNEENRLETIVHTKLSSGTPVLSSHYQYDSSGQRVRKVVYNTTGSIKEVRKYIGGWEVYSKYTGSSSTLQLERETLHVMDDQSRVTMIDTPTVNNTGNDEVQVQRFQLSNHLSTATVELDESGEVIGYEEYYPYGSTSFQSRKNPDISQKRYRYTGKERDEESGFYYHGARYYIPWLCRWSAVDPLESKYVGWSSYNYCTCNPINHTDSTGNGNDDEIKSFTVKEKYYTGSSPSDLNVLIPKGSQVMTYSQEGKGLPYIIAIKTQGGDVYKWSENSQWFTTDKGKDYSNPGFVGLTFDITNWGQSNVKSSLGQVALDALEKGDPFSSIKSAYSEYKNQGGGYGVLGFLGTGVKESAVQTYEDVKAGGHRRTNAMIGMWQFGSSVAKGSLTSNNLKPISVSLGTRERLASFSKSVGFLNYNTWEQLGYHSAKSFDEAFHTTMEKVVKSGGTIAMDITDMNLELSKMVKGLGLYDEVGNAAAYGEKYVRYTDWELGQVLSNKDYFRRVVFYESGKVQNKMTIYNKFYGK